MKKRYARGLLTEAIARAIGEEMDRIVADENRGLTEEARLRITGWMSPRLYRQAATAAVAVLEAGREGERLMISEGDPDASQD
jgi:hypothetical protein